MSVPQPGKNAEAILSRCKAVERIPKVVVLRQHSQYWSKAEPAAQLISTDYVVFIKD